MAGLENAYTQDDVQMRMAVDKVDVLRKQVGVCYDVFDSKSELTASL